MFVEFVHQSVMNHGTFAAQVVCTSRLEFVLPGCAGTVWAIIQQMQIHMEMHSLLQRLLFNVHTVLLFSEVSCALHSDN